MPAEVAAAARGAGVFGEIRIEGGKGEEELVCAAKASAEPAEFRVYAEGGKVWVALTTRARWLSQSIEADLVHTGDKVEELLEEELVNLGWAMPLGGPGYKPTFEHFRDKQKRYTFRTPVPKADAQTVAAFLLAYEAAFRPLGDMEADGEG